MFVTKYVTMKDDSKWEEQSEKPLKRSVSSKREEEDYLIGNEY